MSVYGTSTKPFIVQVVKCIVCSTAREGGEGYINTLLTTVCNHKLRKTEHFIQELSLINSMFGVQASQPQKNTLLTTVCTHKLRTTEQ